VISGVADTHAALWHLFDDARLSRTAADFIDAAAFARRRIVVSSVSLAEVVYLIEKNRLPPSVYDDLKAALADPDHVLKEAPFTSEIVDAMRQVPRAAVPDMPDRGGHCGPFRRTRHQPGPAHSIIRGFNRLVTVCDSLKPEVSMQDTPHPQINSAKIAVGSGVAGAIFTIGSMLIFLTGLPVLWYLFAAAIVLGGGVALVLRFARHKTPGTPWILSATKK
jgi:PIN domain nuclease of toxin-antitoxin system